MRNTTRFLLCALASLLFAGCVVAPAWAGGIGPLKARIVSVLDDLGVTTGGVYTAASGAIDGTADQWEVEADGDLSRIAGSGVVRNVTSLVGQTTADLNLSAPGEGQNLNLTGDTNVTVTASNGGISLSGAVTLDSDLLAATANNGDIGSAPTPWRTLYINHVAAATQSVATTATLGATSAETVLVSSTGAYTITLPSAATAGAGRRYVFLANSTVTLANRVTLDGDGTETINGATTMQIDLPYTRGSIVSDGTNWLIDTPFSSATHTFTPTSNFTNVTYTDNGTIRRQGHYAHIHYEMAFTGAPGAATLAIDPPSGITFDTADLPSVSFAVGRCMLFDTSTSGLRVSDAYLASGKLALHTDPDGTAAAVTEAAPWAWASGDLILVDVWVPVTEWQ